MVISLPIENHEINEGTEVHGNPVVATVRATFLTWVTITTLSYKRCANENHAVAAVRATILISGLLDAYKFGCERVTGPTRSV